MKVTIELECSPSEFKELMVPGETQTEFFQQVTESLAAKNPFMEQVIKSQADFNNTWDELRNIMFNAWEKQNKK